MEKCLNRGSLKIAPSPERSKLKPEGVLQICFFISLLFFSCLQAESQLGLNDVEGEKEHLYAKNQVRPLSSYEMFLIEHAKNSLERAFFKESKLQEASFCFSPLVVHHLLNNLCCLPCASFIHSGIGNGEFFLGALYGNFSLLSKKLGVSVTDKDFKKNEAYQTLAPYLPPNAYEVASVSWNQPLSGGVFDIYFHDAQNSLSPFKMMVYLNVNFSETFILVIDDWNWEWVRNETFKAFDALQYEILLEQEILPSPDLGNGQYMAVIRRSLSSIGEDKTGINE